MCRAGAFHRRSVASFGVCPVGVALAVNRAGRVGNCRWSGLWSPRPRPDIETRRGTILRAGVVSGPVPIVSWVEANASDPDDRAKELICRR